MKMHLPTSTINPDFPNLHILKLCVNELEQSKVDTRSHAKILDHLYIPRTPVYYASGMAVEQSPASTGWLKHVQEHVLPVPVATPAAGPHCGDT